MLLQLANRIWASCWLAGVRLLVDPKGDIIVDIALFSLLGVLLKLNARPTFILVREANLCKKRKKKRNILVHKNLSIFSQVLLKLQN